MKLSIVMPYLNDSHVLSMTLPRILEGMPEKGAELIIVDDGSFDSLYTKLDPRVKVIRLEATQGVGLAFNKGVDIAESCNIVLMGCDVIPQDGWYERVQETLKKSTSRIYCSVSSEFNEETEPFSASVTRRYGANLSYMVTNENLPNDSKQRNDTKYAKILQTQWNYNKPKVKAFAEVECILGAFYWMKKEHFEKIRGFNGHRRWGSLEPLLSIKARAHGIKLVVDTKLESAHYYDRKIHRPIRPDFIYYNMLFMASTLFSDSLRDDLIDHLLYDTEGNKRGRLNVNQAMKIISRSYGLIQKERDYNNRHFKKGLIKNFDKI